MKKEVIILSVVFSVILGVYRYTAYPTVSWVDSGVIAAAAQTLGIANPPGFPLYMLLGNLFTKLPYNTLIDLQILSHVGALLALGCVYYWLRKLKINEWVSLAVVVATAFSYQWWGMAGNVETFTLTYSLMFLLMTLGVKWGGRLESEGVDKNTKLVICIIILSILIGLSLGLNPTMTALVGPGIWWIWKYFKIIKKRPGLFLTSFLLLIAFGIAIYAYLPIRAAAKPFVNWGDPVNWERIQKHLVGAGLNIYEPETNSINGFTGKPIVWWESFWHFWEMAIWQWTPLLFPLVLYGAYILFRKNRQYFWPLFWLFFVNLLYVVLYYGGNQESWMMASWLVFGVFLGVGAGEVRLLIVDSRLQKILLVVIALVPLVFWWPTLNHRKFNFAQDYLENLYRGLPEKAVIIGGGDYFHAVTAYGHEVLGYRKDITIITGNMFYIFPWYREHLKIHTNLKLTDELNQIVQFKSAEEFTQLVDKLVADNPDRHFFVTPLLLNDTVVAGHKDGNYHTTKYELVPNGLVYKIEPLSLESSNRRIDEEVYNFKFSNPELYSDKPPLYLERNYKNAYKLLRDDYARAFLNLGDYYWQHNEKEKAEQALLKANGMASLFNVSFANRLAIYYAETGQVEKAKEYFDKALIKDPDNKDLRSNYNAFMESINPKTNEASASAGTLEGEQIYRQTFKGDGFGFDYPKDWMVIEGEKGLMILPIKGGFKIQMAVEPSDMPAEIYALEQKDWSGKLQNQGKAKFPNTDSAYLKIWDNKGVIEMQFFVKINKKMFNLLVSPATNTEMMREFNNIAGSIREEGENN